MDAGSTVVALGTIFGMVVILVIAIQRDTRVNMKATSRSFEIETNPARDAGEAVAAASPERPRKASRRGLPTDQTMPD